MAPRSKNGLEEAPEAIKQLADLQAEIDSLKAENKTLKERLYSPVSQDSQMLKEEMIAHEQLERLKFTSESRELTLEETKKVEIFFKVLSAIRSKVKPKEENLSEVPDAELLKLADHFKLSS